MISIQLRPLEPKTTSEPRLGHSRAIRRKAAFGLAVLAVLVGSAILGSRLIRFAKSEEELKQSLLRQPENAALYLAYGRALMRAGNPERAIGAYRGGLLLRPKDVPTRLALAETLMALGRLSEAQRQLEAALTAEPASVEARLSLGQIYTARRQFPSAARVLSQASTAKPDARLLVALGEANSRMDEWERAEVAFRAALRLEPRRPRAISGLAQVLAHKGQPDEAAKLFQQACKLAPDDPATWHAAGYHALQTATPGATMKAVRCFERELKLNSGSAVTFYLLGMAQRRSGRREDAVESLQSAALLDPGERSVAFEQASLFAELGDSTKSAAARARFSRLLALQTEEEKLRRRMAATPPTAAAYRRIATLLRAQGRDDRALWELEIALNLFPNDPALHRIAAPLLKLRGGMSRGPKPTIPTVP